ncbi:MAG: hypothetical protein N3E36_05145 [Sulfolobales archaeon]|nr:hypothetical protein [Sulfolobales archaeon]MCX8199396.1 hypothetical protein [Sulfolobales archaeon]MDW8170290.1 hypothetical protein [Desulfurococcaceae archaeon]
MDLEEFVERVVSEISYLCKAIVEKEDVLDAIYNALLSSLNNLKFCARAYIKGMECKLCIYYEVAFIGLSEVEVVNRRHTLVLPSTAPLNDEVELLFKTTTEILSVNGGAEVTLSQSSLNYLVNKGIECREIEYELLPEPVTNDYE